MILRYFRFICFFAILFSLCFCTYGYDTADNEKLTKKILFDENTGCLTLLYINDGKDTVKVNTTFISFLLHVNMVGSDSLPDEIYDKLLDYKTGRSFGGHSRSDSITVHFSNDDNVELNPGEFIGRYKYIWEINDWNFIREGFKKFPKTSFFIEPNSFLGISKSDSSIIINYSLFKKMEQLRYKMSQKVQTSDVPEPEDIYEDLKKLGHYPYAVKYDNQHWRIPIYVEPKSIVDFQLLLERKTGKLYAFMKYNGQIYQSKFMKVKKENKDGRLFLHQDTDLDKKSLYYTNLNLTDLFGIMDIQNSIGCYVEDYYSRGQYYDKLNDIIWNEEEGPYKDKTDDERFEATWWCLPEGRPVPKKTEKTMDRQFTLSPTNTVVGSVCYIWDIPEWKKLGRVLKKYKKSFYLINVQDSSYVYSDYYLYHEKFPPGRTLKVDLKLYNEMEKLRQSILKKKK